MTLRTSPSGSLFDTVSVPPIAQQLGWLPASGASLLLPLLAAGHAPGVYLCTTVLIRRVAATNGTATRSLTFSAREGSVTILSAATALNATGAIAILLAFANSTGQSAITAQMTPAGIVGAPVVDLYANAIRIGD